MGIERPTRRRRPTPGRSMLWMCGSVHIARKHEAEPPETFDGRTKPRLGLRSSCSSFDHLIIQEARYSTWEPRSYGNRLCCGAASQPRRSELAAGRHQGAAPGASQLDRGAGRLEALDKRIYLGLGRSAADGGATGIVRDEVDNGPAGRRGGPEEGGARAKLRRWG